MPITTKKENILQNVSATQLFDKKLELIQRRRKTHKVCRQSAAAAAIGLSNVPGVGAIAQVQASAVQLEACLEL